MTTPTDAHQSIPKDPTVAADFVRRIARGIHAGLPRHVDLEELVAAGFLGYAEALGRWQSGKGAQFLTFAHYRVKGAIRDAVRRMARDASRFTPTDFGADDDAMEDHRHAGPSPAAVDLRAEVSRICGKHLAPVAGAAQALPSCADSTATPDAIVEHREQVELLQTALGSLSADDRQLLAWIHHDELSLAEIGARLDRDKAVVFRRHQAALARLRTAFLVANNTPIAAIA